MGLVKLFFDGIDVYYNKKQNPKEMIKKYKEKVDVINNIPYFSSKFSKLDLYLPKVKQDKYKIHIYIHGGGFLAGNKKYRRGHGYYFAGETNNIVLNVEYTKSPKYTFEQSLFELINVYRWLYENQNKYNFDLNNVSIGGDSSGAYFAFYMSLISTNEKLQKHFNYSPLFTVKKAILNCGVYDYSKVDMDPKFKKIYEDIIKACSHLKMSDLESSPLKELFIPLNYVDENSCEMLICYSKRDFFCKGQSEILIKKLKEYKIKYDEVMANEDRYDHCFSLGWHSPKAKEFNEKYVEFIK